MNGQIAGRYRTSGKEKFHLFRLDGGVFVSFADLPEAAQMAPTSVCSHHSGMNGAGDIVTGYCDSKPVQNNTFNDNMLSHLHGVQLSGGTYTSFDFPGANGTTACGINDSDAIVGGYQDTNGIIHGFLRTP